MLALSSKHLKVRGHTWADHAGSRSDFGICTTYVRSVQQVALIDWETRQSVIKEQSSALNPGCRSRQGG